MMRPEVQVVVEGYLVREGSQVKDASSTVTLVRTSDKTVMVDTGKADGRKGLERALKAMQVRPDRVDAVVNTHLHRDHCGCNDLFENARFYAHELEEPPVGTVRVAGMTRVLEGVTIRPTPGHTRGCVSVFVEADKRYAICGDAIPTKGNYERHAPPFINIDLALALRTADAIVEWADVVVPGHDGPFEVRGKK